MSMPKSPDTITYDPATDTVVGDGVRKALNECPATWLRKVAAQYGVPAGPGNGNAILIEGIRAAASGGKIPSPTPTPTPAPAVVATKQTDDLASILRDAIGIDEARVIELIAQHAPEGTSRVVEVRRPDAPPVKIESAHAAFDDCLGLLMQREASSNRYPYLMGPAGSGKSHLAGQMATALDLPFYSLSCTSVPQDHCLAGFMAADGITFSQTAFYLWAKFGGIYLLDEMDRAYPSTLVVLNDALASRRYMFPNGEMVYFHEDAHMIGAGNTAGQGATSQYSAAVVLDGSTLNRFSTLKVNYDAAVEAAMVARAGLSGTAADKLTERVARIRSVIDEQGITAIHSPRTTAAIAAGIAHGWTEAKAWDIGFFNALDSDTVRKLATV
jgi:cobaltochelatase CobS